jgi:predicted phage terminase large subunit-like protein
VNATGELSQLARANPRIARALRGALAEEIVGRLGRVSSASAAVPVVASLTDWLPLALPDYTWTAPHFTAMIAVLDRVTAGELRRCYFQIPIRHGKSTLNTLAYAVHRLERDPKTRIIVASYNQRQADKFSREVRRLARTRGVSISGDRDAAGEWETTAGGGVRAVGAGAGLASVNADLILVDDPIGSRDDAESPAKRDQVWDWLTNDVLARAEPHTAVLVTMSRWHQDDPAGRLLDQQRERWHVLDLPARAEPDDPLGRAEHAPLWPEMRGEAWLDEKLVELTPYGFASLLQGRPRPRAGGMFQWDWWSLVDDLPTQCQWVRYWDMAGTRPKSGGHDPDYTAGVLATRMRDGRTMIGHVSRFRTEVAARDAQIVAQARADVARFGQGRVTYWLEAQAGISGEDATRYLLRQLHAVGIAAFAERPTGSKIERATPLASAALAGNVCLGPEDAAFPWRDAFRLELADAPTGRHDDQLDAAAGAFAKLAAPTSSVSTFRPRI